MMNDNVTSIPFGVKQFNGNGLHMQFSEAIALVSIGL